jgi:Family of unknown function (UPF0738)
MNNRIELTEAIIEKNNLILKTEAIPANINSLKAKGQMLVDSDHLAFIYILETEDEFVYAGLPHTIWTKLKEANEKNLHVILKINEVEIELVAFFDELNYLLENIKDNANYGEEMENKVVELFSL